MVTCTQECIYHVMTMPSGSAMRASILYRRKEVVYDMGGGMIKIVPTSWETFWQLANLSQRKLRICRKTVYKNAKQERLSRANCCVQLWSAKLYPRGCVESCEIHATSSIHTCTQEYMDVDPPSATTAKNLRESQLYYIPLCCSSPKEQLL